MINFLSGLLSMTVPKNAPLKVSPSYLVLLENYSLNSFKSLNLDSKDLLNGDIDEEYKVRVLYVTLKLLEEFYNNLRELSSSTEIFEPILKQLEVIPVSNYSKEVKTCLEVLTNTLKDGKANKKLRYIVMEAERPKALRLYEPKIEVV